MTDWIDAHTHLDAEELHPKLPEVLLRAEAAGVRTLLLVNSEATESSFQKTFDCLKQQSPIQRYLSFGIHPHHAVQYDPNLQGLLLRFLAAEKVIALGEIGLDFYYNYSPKDIQIAVLHRQLRLALEKNLPVVIHCRDAYGELREILAEESSAWRGMIHCFTGTPQEAESLLQLGFYISFSGIITFRSAEVLRDAARIVPVNRILIETDAPYLAPAPYRGKTNEPAFVAETGKYLARLRQMNEEAFAAAVTGNFHSLFGQYET
ncbi:MAG TPA: TatD family hydrolase [Acidobacteriota bacterium]|nr:TatD family hydrolase [Acidobacteriota bacterium]